MRKIFKTTSLLGMGLFLLIIFLGIISAITELIDVGDYEVEYEYIAAKAEAGEKFSLKITITNEADEDKTDITFTIDDDDPFDVDGDDSFTISSLAESESDSETFRIEIDDDAKDQDYDLPFILEDSKEDYEEEMEISVDSNIPELIIGNVESIPLTLGPDIEDIQFILTIENIGGGDAEFIRVKIELPDGFSPSSSYSDISNLGIIKEGENKQAIFFIDTDENLGSGNYQGTLNLEYEDPNSDKITEFINFDLPVKGRPQFIISKSSTNPSPIPAGTKGAELKITVVNKGAEEGKETSIRVFESSDQPFEFNEKTRNIGSLERSISGSAIFTMDVEGDAKPNTYFLKVQIRTVSDGNVLVTEKTIPVKVAEEEGSNLIVIIMVLIIILAIIIFFVLRRRKKK